MSHLWDAVDQIADPPVLEPEHSPVENMDFVIENIDLLDIVNNIMDLSFHDSENMSQVSVCSLDLCCVLHNSIGTVVGPSGSSSSNGDST